MYTPTLLLGTVEITGKTRKQPGRGPGTLKGSRGRGLGKSGFPERFPDMDLLQEQCVCELEKHEPSDVSYGAERGAVHRSQ